MKSSRQKGGRQRQCCRRQRWQNPTSWYAMRQLNDRLPNWTTAHWQRATLIPTTQKLNRQSDASFCLPRQPYQRRENPREEQADGKNSLQLPHRSWQGRVPSELNVPGENRLRRFGPKSTYSRGGENATHRAKWRCPKTTSSRCRNNRKSYEKPLRPVASILQGEWRPWS